MMSQNRQQERDRAEARFISGRILRNEHLTRHINAKLDFLLSNQWRRLMEIQEIQLDLVSLGFQFHHQVADARSERSSTSLHVLRTMEFRNDPHIRSLLLAYFVKVGELGPRVPECTRFAGHH